MKQQSSSDERMGSFATLAPLKFVVAYLTATFSIAIWGPVKYAGFPVEKTAIFMIAVVMSIAIGYVVGAASKLSPSRSRAHIDDRFVRRLFNFSLAISLAALAVSILSAGVSGRLNTDISKIGSAYLSGYENYERNTGSYSLEFIIYSFSLPFNFIAIIIGLYYFRSIGNIRQTFVLLLILGGIFFYALGSGKQKQLGDILIFLIAVGAVKYGVGRRPIKIRWVFWATVVMLLFAFAFVEVLDQRYSALGVDFSNVNHKVSDRTFFDTSHPFFLIFGLDAGLILAIFLSYLSQGYYGLGLALETNWEWTRFLGFSYAISVIGNRFLGLEWEWPNNLLNQVGNATGWGTSKWHTVFTHFATDFSFPGTVLLFGYFAFVYARAWRLAIQYENPLAILTFTLLTMGVFFMPANNQLLHSPGGLLTVIMIVTLYTLKGHRFNCRSDPWLSGKNSSRASSN